MSEFWCIDQQFNDSGNAQGERFTRIAEYDYDDVAGTSSLIREYVWMNGQVVAVIEGGAVYYVRTDHIGRPVFATNGSGTKVWTASYLPFGGVDTSTGSNIDLRFPGQWFQSEAGLLRGSARSGLKRSPAAFPGRPSPRTGCATTTRRWGGICRPIRWGWWMGRASMGM